MKSTLTIGMLLGLSFACTSLEDKGNPNELELPVLIDTFTSNPTYLERKSSSWSSYLIMFAGKLNDTAVLANPQNTFFGRLILQNYITQKNRKKTLKTYSDTIRGPFDKYLIDDEMVDCKRYLCDSFILGIRVDTSCKISKPKGMYSEDSNYYFAYPIYIQNHSGDTVCIAGDGLIPLELEAKDQKGQWHCIENISRGCGNGIHYSILPPEHSVISAVHVFKGKFKTKLRLKMRYNYSNEYDGYINKEQFD